MKYEARGGQWEAVENVEKRSAFGFGGLERKFEGEIADIRCKNWPKSSGKLHLSICCYFHALVTQQITITS